MSKSKYGCRGYLRITSETHAEKEGWSVARLVRLPAKGKAPEEWMVSVDSIDPESMMCGSEFFDTFEEALEYARGFDVVIWEKDGERLHHDLQMIPATECWDRVYAERARKMDVSADERGMVRIYTDLAYNGAGAREINLTKEQAMWLAEFLPEALRAMPEFGWEERIGEQIAQRRQDKADKANE